MYNQNKNIFTLYKAFLMKLILVKDKNEIFKYFYMGAQPQGEPAPPPRTPLMGYVIAMYNRTVKERSKINLPS